MDGEEAMEGEEMELVERLLDTPVGRY